MAFSLFFFAQNFPPQTNSPVKSKDAFTVFSPTFSEKWSPMVTFNVRGSQRSLNSRTLVKTYLGEC